MRWLSLIICVLSWPLLARGGERDAAMEHQLGLYLQYTRGALPAAIGAYERAVQRGADASLSQSIYLRMAECLRLGGDRSPAALTALERATSAEWNRFGPAAVLPQQSNLILQLDLSRLELKRWASGLKLDLPLDAPRLLRSFGRKTGVDPGKSLRRLTLGLTLKNDPARLFEHMQLVIEGDLQRFTPGSLLSWLRDEAAEPGAPTRRSEPLLMRTAEPNTFRLYVPTDDKKLESSCCPGLRQLVVHFEEKQIRGLPGLLVRFVQGRAEDEVLQLDLVKFDDQRVLLGERRALGQTIEALRGRLPGVRANEPLARLVTGLPRDTILWLVARPKQMFSQIEVVQRVLGLEDDLPEVSGVSAHLSAAENLTLQITATSSDRQSAKVLGDLALGSLALLRLATAGEQAKRFWLATFLNGLSLDVEGARVRLVAHLPLAPQSGDQAKSP